ncbi:MAG: hypothetical protein IMZ60_00025 [Actinobacteria bacterium]|nr:hypothetical protein [Actinomycetota bacterium]
MSPTKYSEDHRKIKETIEKIRKETEGSSCVIVSELAKEIEMDPRLLRKHMEVMEIDGYGHFSDTKKRHIFCRKK